MKRSEMIEIMTRTWRDYVHNLTPDRSGIREGMDKVLTAIEQAGMLPPARWRDHDWIERGISYADWLQEPGKINEWESKND